MNDQPFTLTDIQRGMWELKLHSVLGEEFKLFWGLIMTSNALRFKNPIEVVNAQAMVLAKVNSREMLRRRRNALTKKRIYGNWILRYESGNRMFNESGKYEINLDFLASAASAWNDKIDSTEGLSTPVDAMEQSQRQKGYEKRVFSEPIQSGIIVDSTEGLSTGVDSTVDRSVTQPLTDPLTTLRSDQRREEKKNNTEAVVDSEKSEQEKARERSKEVEYLQDMILNAFHPQITAKPPYAACRSALDKHGFDILEAAAVEAKGRSLRNPTPQAALNYVQGIVRNAASGIDYAQRNKLTMKLQDLKADLRAAENETDLTKLAGIFVDGGILVGGQIVNTIEEYCKMTQSEIDRIKKLLGG